MIKKIVSLASAGAILLSAAVPVFAFQPWHFHHTSRDVALVENSALSVADTGGNTQNNSASVNRACRSGARASSRGSRNMTTGNASAYAGALVVANTHVGCSTCGQNRSHNDFAGVGNYAEAGAFTGNNHQNDSASTYRAYRSGARAGSGGSRNMRTGNASARSRAWTVVNSHVSFGM